MCDRCGSDIHPANVSLPLLLSLTTSGLLAERSVDLTPLSFSFYPSRTAQPSGESTLTSLPQSVKTLSPNDSVSKPKEASRVTSSRLILILNGLTRREGGAITVLKRVIGET
jgi:hypothetical protein